MDYLINAFKDKSLLGDSMERIPDNIDVLRKKFEITFPDEDIRSNFDHREPLDIHDIKAGVIWNTILRSVQN